MRTPIAAVALAALAACVVSSASGSVCVTAGAYQPSLRVNSHGTAEVRWLTASGASRYAIITPTGLCKHQGVRMAGRDVSHRVTGVHIPFRGVVKQTPDGAFWALQSWRRRPTEAPELVLPVEGRAGPGDRCGDVLPERQRGVARPGRVPRPDCCACASAPRLLQVLAEPGWLGSSDKHADHINRHVRAGHPAGVGGIQVPGDARRAELRLGTSARHAGSDFVDSPITPIPESSWWQPPR